MNKKVFINIIIIITFVGVVGFVFLKKSSVVPMTCGQYMGGREKGFSPYETDKRIIEECDNDSFIIFNHEYAKDKNFVYFRPMPNGSWMTVVVKDVDPKTFELFERCPGMAIDKNHVIQGGAIIKDRIPYKKYDQNNPQTYCWQ